MARLTDNDRHLGRFITYARSSWNPLRLVYSSGASEDSKGPNTLTAYAFGWVARVSLPRLLEDFTERHVAQSWDAATVARMGRNWYEERFLREYGFSLHEGFLQVFLGAQTHDSTTTQSWCCHLPWTQWRFHRFSLYDTAGVQFWTQYERRGHKYRDFDAQHKATAECPKAAFLIDDFDGQRITATTHIEEREWKFEQRRFLHGPVLGQIVEQAKADGQRFVMAVWKEYYRAKFLGFRWEHYKLPGQKKATPRKVRVSTEDLSIKQYSEYIDKVLADAATEFGVVFDLDPAGREAVRYVRPVRAKKQAEAVPA